MSNFAVDDLHRSLRRYVAAVFGKPWVVRTERQPVRDDDREVIVIEPASGVTTGRHRVSIPQGGVEKIMAFSAMAYPALMTTSRESRHEAQRVADLLDGVFTLGLVEELREGVQTNLGAPFRVPVWDYDGVSVTGRDRAGPDDPYGLAWVSDLSVRAVQDPVDSLRFTVACDLRLGWLQAGRAALTGPEVRSMLGTFVTP